MDNLYAWTDHVGIAPIRPGGGEGVLLIGLVGCWYFWSMFFLGFVCMCRFQTPFFFALSRVAVWNGCHSAAVCSFWTNSFWIHYGSCSKKKLRPLTSQCLVTRGLALFGWGWSCGKVHWLSQALCDAGTGVRVASTSDRDYRR